MNVAAYLGRTYPHPPCYPMLRDILRTEFSLEAPPLRGVTASVRDSARAFAEHLESTARAFGYEPVPAPVEDALVFMGRSGKLGIFHCGIYCEGKVLHPLQNVIVHQDLHSLRDEYQLMQFWERHIARQNP